MVEQLPFFALNLLFVLLNDDNLLLGMLWGATTVLIKVYHMVTLDRLDFLQLTIVNNLSETSTPGLIFRTFITSKFVWYVVLFVFLDMFMAKLLVFDVFQGVSSVSSLLYGIQFAVMAIDNLAYVWKLSLNLYELMYYRCPSHPSTASTPTTSSPNDSTPAPASAQEGTGSGNTLDDERTEAPDMLHVPEPEETAQVEDEHEDEDDLEDFSDDEDDGTERVWENKAIFSHSLDILAAVVKSAFYLVFSYMLYVHSNVMPPLPMLQGGIMSMLRVVNKSRAFVSFLSNSKSLDKQLVAASEEDLDDSDHMCIICRENMHLPEVYQARRHKPLAPRKYPKKLACGHILHLGCLKDWLERSTVCPLCRKPVFPAPVAAEPEAQAEPERTDIPVVPQEAPVFQRPVPLMENPETRLVFQELLERSERLHRGITNPAPPRTQGMVSAPPSTVETTTELNFDGTVPNGWEVLPLSGTGPDEFSIRLSSTHSGTLTVRENKRDLSFYTLERV